MEQFFTYRRCFVFVLRPITLFYPDSHPRPSPSSPSFSLLHVICGLGQDEAAELLLGPKAKADPGDASNAEGLTPLHAAAMAGSLACVELLLSHGEG